jgi:hypothetical protein
LPAQLITNVRPEAPVQIAIVIDVAFMVVVFLFVSLVRPDLHIESGRSLLEFRDPLSLRPMTENVSADENREVSQPQCVPHQEMRGGTD